MGNRAFSRIHCNFTYDNEQKLWSVNDGFDTPSTNGIW